MRKHLVYDLPLRIFHGLFASLFLIAFTIGKTIDDDSLLFSYHMLAGILLSALVLWRIGWGFVGSRHARFSDYSLSPKDLLLYFQGILTGSQRKWIGHNPASSWAALTMFGLSLGLGITGYLMTTGNKKAFEEVHEVFAHLFILVVIFHVAGVLLHTLRHQDAIALSMIDGRKTVESDGKSIPSQRVFSALVLMALLGGLSMFLFKNFDAQNRTLKIGGQLYQLGESAKSQDHLQENGSPFSEEHDNEE